MIEAVMKMVSKKTTCPKHKKYKAVRMPTSHCPGCWIKWYEEHPYQADAAELIKSCLGKGEIWLGVIIPALRQLSNSVREENEKN